MKTSDDNMCSKPQWGSLRADILRLFVNYEVMSVRQEKTGPAGTLQGGPGVLQAASPLQEVLNVPKDYYL